MRRVGILVFRVDRHRIAAGDGLEPRTVTTPFLLVRQTYQREANQGGTLTRVFQRVDIRRCGVILSGQHRGDFGEDTFPAAAGAGDFEKELPVVAVRQHHKQRGQNHVAFCRVATGRPVEPAPEVRRVGFQCFPFHWRGEIHVAQGAQPVRFAVRAEYT